MGQVQDATGSSAMPVASRSPAVAGDPPGELVIVMIDHDEDGEPRCQDGQRGSLTLLVQER